MFTVVRTWRAPWTSADRRRCACCQRERVSSGWRSGRGRRPSYPGVGSGALPARSVASVRRGGGCAAGAAGARAVRVPSPLVAPPLFPGPRVPRRARHCARRRKLTPVHRAYLRRSETGCPSWSRRAGPATLALTTRAGAHAAQRRANEEMRGPSACRRASRRPCGG